MIGSALTGVHQRLGVAVVVLGVAGAIWAVVGIRRRRVEPGLRVYLLLTELAMVVQALLGVALALQGERPRDSLHWIYGPVTLLAIPVAWALGRTGPRPEALALLAASVAVVLLGARAVVTGGG